VATGDNLKLAELASHASTIWWGSMRKYEIRILKKYKRASVVFTSSQPSDAIAIQVAHELSEECGFEVWHEMNCICRQIPKLSTPRDGRVAASRSAQTKKRL